MRVCPNCGYENEETATICVRCNQALPPPAPPDQRPAAPALRAPIQLPASQAQSARRKTLQYFLGVGFGLIPLIAFILGLGLSSPSSSATSPLLGISFLLYLAAISALIALFSKESLRFVGYGLLTLVLISPVVAFISCIVALSHSQL